MRIKYRNNEILIQIKISLGDLFATLNIWNKADPTTTNKKIPNTIGPS